jgi:tryptophan halogenase
LGGEFMALSRFPTHLVILGGGSAGWMSAAFLDRSFNLPGRRRLPITVVESPSIGRIGVGEATVPTLVQFTHRLGLDEPTFMKRTQATFKHGIEFIDWNGPGTRYFHPFQALDRQGLNSGPSWLARRHAGIAEAFDKESGLQAAVARAGRAPKKMIDPDYLGMLPYAYHLDADAYGDMLAELARLRGVEHVRGKVTGVDLGDDGDVTTLVLDDGRRLDGDLFLDCSGFRSLLLGEKMGVPYENFSDALICDRAVAIGRPYQEDEAPRPYTVAQAKDAGWMWRIGLQNRLGMGYVYSSRFASPEEAERALRSAGSIPDDSPARHLALLPGMPQVSWAGNVVGIGLAGGFIEPLESTGLHMVERGLELLVRYFPLSGINRACRDKFNLEMRRHWLDLRDFVTAHYCLTKRTDTPFWREVREAEHIPPSLAARLEMWSDRHPDEKDNESSRMMFVHNNWQSIIYGLDAAQPQALANAARWCPNPGNHLPGLRRAEQQALEELPALGLWLDGLDSLPATDLARFA